MYKWILLAHAIGGATMFGAHVYMEALMASANRAGDDGAYMSTMTRLAKTADRVMGPASIITIVFGFWLVFETSYEFEDVFVVIGVTAWIAAFAVSMFLVNPKMKEVDALIEEKGAGDPESVARMKSIGTLVHVLSAITAFAFIVMVIKPGIL